MEITAVLLERFWSKVGKGSAASCWEWTGARIPQGYGSLGTRERSQIGAHRISWSIHNGPIPPGMFVLHRCDNPPCVNPAHLFLGTQLDNMRDKLQKGRQGDSTAKTLYRGAEHRLRHPPESLPRGPNHWSAMHPEARPRGEAHGCARLTEPQVLEIRALSREGASQREIARRFSVHQGTVWHIVQRKTWVHLEAR
jgi:hypothetical protein